MNRNATVTFVTVGHFKNQEKFLRVYSCALMH